MQIDQIKQEIKNILSEKRFYHSLCVMEKCEQLAQQYHVNTEMAKLVGLTHDIAKEMTKTEMLEYIKKHNIPINKIERDIPALLHGKIGADICQKKYKFRIQMVKAIEAHTTAKENMDNLAKILYVADAISEDRKEPYVEEARKLVRISLDDTILYLLDSILQEKINNKERIHPDSIAARNQILEKKRTSYKKHYV